MNSIKENYIYEEIIKKSKFITYLYKINSEKEIKDILSNIKLKHKDSTHVCYAYRLNELEKCIDDGEPSGTAGMPILNILKKENLNFILCIVVRYFGGIKLGAGGLIRAYGGSCKNALKHCEIVTIEKGVIVDITFSYENSKDIDFLLKNSIILSKKYETNINYVFKIKVNDFNIIKDNLNVLCKNINILENIYL